MTPDATTTPDATAEPDATNNPDGSPPAACEYDFSALGSHFYEVLMLTDPAQYQCDANNDGKVNDQDGALNQVLSGGLVASFLNVNQQLADAVKKGSLIFLMELAAYAGGNATGVTTHLFLGAPIEDQPDPTCGVESNPQGVCDWLVDPNSFGPNCDPRVTIPGCTVSGGALACGPADFMFTLVISGAQLDLPVNDGRLKGNLSGSGVNVADGRLCGEVPKQAIKDALDAACAKDPTQTFCSVVGFLDFVITCDPCSLVVGLEGKQITSMGMGAAQAP
jgi:hypothetical protein